MLWLSDVWQETQYLPIAKAIQNIFPSTLAALELPEPFKFARQANIDEQHVFRVCPVFYMVRKGFLKGLCLDFVFGWLGRNKIELELGLGAVGSNLLVGLKAAPCQLHLTWRFLEAYSSDGKSNKIAEQMPGHRSNMVRI